MTLNKLPDVEGYWRHGTAVRVAVLVVSSSLIVCLHGK